MSQPWTCADVGSFAWRTCTQRWPTIVNDLRCDLPAFDAALQQLCSEISVGTVVPLDDDNVEGARWSASHAFVDKPWTALPWYFGESFLYAKIRALVRYADTAADPFLVTKQRQEGALPPMADDDDLAAAMGRSLWGNRADLSLPSALTFSGSADADLVADDGPQARLMLAEANTVGILLDNAGVELAYDLSLTRLLLRRGKRVLLFCKDMPFFVSDATIADVVRTQALLGWASAPGLEIVDDAFLTGPDFLTTAAMSAALRVRLETCDVVIAKGDCNYRRLVGDIPPTTRPFAAVVSFPAPVIALRTLKAEVLVGADAHRVAAAQIYDDWLVSGRFGLVQVALSTLCR